jgi:TPP-dependent pyruvate/acetoin dehydrogenase alpha subunit
VDGNDVLAVYEATRRAIERARAGRGPTLIEADTMRMRGHAEHDDMKYVPPALLEQWAARDPIPRYEKRLLAAHAATQEDLDRIVSALDASLQEDLAAAEASPMPDSESGLDGVYADRSVPPPTPLLVVEWEARKGRR